MSIQELYRATQAGGIQGPSKDTIRPETRSNEFQALLDAERTKVNLSSHAETRIRSREIAWNPQLEARVAKGLDQAQSKGSKDTLILVDDLAVIANVKSRTVVTAMDPAQMKERIFTNIDSAVLA